MSKLRSPRILHIASGDLWAGAEVQLFTLVKSLRELGANISIVVLNHGILEQKLRDAGVTPVVLEESKLNGFQIFYQLYRTIKLQRPDIIHTHRIKENILGSLAGFLAGGATSVRTLHGVPEHPPKWWQFPQRMIHFTDWFCGRFIQKRIILVTDNLVRILSRSYPPRMISVIENGIDVKSITSRGDRHEKHSGSGKPVFDIGLAGRLVPVKRVDLFIRMAQYIRDRNPKAEYRFWIYGDGPLHQELRRLAEQLKLGKSVLFEGHCENMASRLGELDLLVMTSDNEGLPMILLEAMAMRVPVVAHAAGGISKLLDQGACGILVRDHSPAGYAGAVMQFLENPGLRKKLSDRALERVKQYYSATNNAAAYLEEYNAISGRK